LPLARAVISSSSTAGRESASMPAVALCPTSWSAARPNSSTAARLASTMHSVAASTTSTASVATWNNSR
jgi:hypothetical protein